MAQGSQEKALRIIDQQRGRNAASIAPPRAARPGRQAFNGKLAENNEGTQVIPLDAFMNFGEGTIYRGAANTGVISGPAFAPELPEALGHSGSADSHTDGREALSPPITTATGAGVEALFKEGK